MPRLVFTNKHFAGQVYELVAATTTVGRDDQNTLVLRDHSVSADHCEIHVFGTEVIVRERGSTNGTFVDGVRVTGQRPVHAGQVLRFGSVEARLEFDTPSPDRSASEVTARWEHSRLIREGQAGEPAPQTSSTRFVPTDPTDLGGQTLTLPKPVPPQPTAVASPPQSASVLARATSRRKLLLLVIGLWLLVPVALWALWKARRSG
jgi:pSer/pThr/pTyr-binding forkhead associated (FHA) protein